MIWQDGIWAFKVSVRNGVYLAMPSESALILMAMTYLAFKHMVADFLLQTQYQYRNKGRYGHMGGLLHSFIHIVATAPLFLILPPSGLLAGFAILCAEFGVHYHIDWLKEALVRRSALTTNDSGFWYLFGFDQLLHSLTYIAIVGFVVAMR